MPGKLQHWPGSMRTSLVLPRWARWLGYCMILASIRMTSNASYMARISGSIIRPLVRGSLQRFARCEPLGQLLAYVIAGHHAGLANGAGGGGTLQDRLDDKKYTIPAVMNWDHDLALPPSLAAPPLDRIRTSLSVICAMGCQLSVLTRMLFSALVDADRLDTETFYTRVDGRPLAPRGDWQSLEVLKCRLDYFMAEKAASVLQLSQYRGAAARQRRARKDPERRPRQGI